MNDATMPSGFRIQDAMAHAAALRDTLLADPDYAFDADLLRDTLDSETSAVDVLRRVVRFVLDSDALADAAKTRLTDLAGRKTRYERRSEQARATALAMMEALGMRSLPDPEFTASIGAGRLGVVIVDDAVLPETFVKTERRPDKALIGAALKAKQDVPGAVLSNGPATLTIRSK